MRTRANSQPTTARSRSSSLLAIGSAMAMFLLPMVIGGCSGGPQPQTQPTVPGYLQLREEFGPRDFSPLKGRRIVVDPGHGGFYRGALGPGGLAEADINLGVALHLRGLLEWAGADVALTRTADYDFLAGTDSTLAADLAFRVSVTDSLQPDVFLSIHHNSNASRDETINETQTYYPLGDEGASLDLARSIHRHLVRNLEISPARILPGNFHVLRNATVPAVLGEPSMLSHPVMEDRLSLAASQRLEAQAYFLGLLDYFADGTPHWAGAAVDTLVLGDPSRRPAVRWTFLPDGPAAEPADPVRRTGPGPDPTSFLLTRDGVPEGYHLSPDGHTVTWQPVRDLPPRPVELVLTGRNLAGRAAPLRRTVVLPPPGDDLTVQLLVSEPGPVLIHWRSASGLRVPSGTLTLGTNLVWRLPGGSEGWLAVESMNTDSSTVEAWFRPDGSDQSRPVPVQFESVPSPWQWRLLDGSAAGVDLAGRLSDRPWRRRLWPEAVSDTGLRDDPTRPAVPIRPGQPAWIDLPGFLPLLGADTADLIGAPTGSESTGPSAATWPVAPLLPAVLDRVVVLDPAGGEGAAHGTGPLGLRGADINLAVARYAERLLVGAGAEVHLTRGDGTLVPLPDKVRLAERVGADLFLTIGRSEVPGRTTAAHHPGSAVGEAWARDFLQAWAPLAASGDSLLSTPSWAYLLRHTACPALEISLPGPVSAEDETRLGEAGWQRAEARAILLAVAAALGQENVLQTTITPPALVAGWDTGFPADSIDWMVLDGNFLWSQAAGPGRTDPESALSPGAGHPLSFRYGPGLPAVGPTHVLEIHAGSRWQLWLVRRVDGGWESELIWRDS